MQEQAVQRNQARQEAAQVPLQSLQKIFETLEPPLASNSIWDKTTLPYTPGPMAVEVGILGTMLAARKATSRCKQNQTEGTADAGALRDD